MAAVAVVVAVAGVVVVVVVAGAVVAVVGSFSHSDENKIFHFTENDNFRSH